MWMKTLWILISWLPVWIYTVSKQGYRIVNMVLFCINLYTVIIFIITCTSHINCIVARCLISVGNLTACAFIRSWWCCTFEWRPQWCWINTKVDNYIIMASLKWLREHMSNHSASLAIQEAFSKPCLVNLISKDTHLVFSIYNINLQWSA